MYTLEELKNDIYSDLIDSSNNADGYYYKIDDSMISVNKSMEIINKRLDEYFNQILPGEEEYYD